MAKHKVKFHPNITFQKYLEIYGQTLANRNKEVAREVLGASKGNFGGQRGDWWGNVRSTSKWKPRRLFI